MSGIQSESVKKTHYEKAKILVFGQRKSYRYKVQEIYGVFYLKLRILVGLKR